VAIAPINTRTSTREKPFDVRRDLGAGSDELIEFIVILRCDTIIIINCRNNANKK